MKDVAALVQYNYAQGRTSRASSTATTRSSARPGRTGLGAGGTNGLVRHAARRVASRATGKSLYNGLTLGLMKRFSHNFQFQAYYTLRGTSPTTTTSATRSPSLREGTRTSTPSTATRTATSATASTPSSSGRRRARSTSTCASLPLGAAALAERDAARVRSRSSAPAPTASARTARIVRAQHRAEGQPVLLLNLRLSRDVPRRRPGHDRAHRRGLQPLQQQEPQEAERQNLLFNFDGTVASGLGDPRQMQLGVSCSGNAMGPAARPAPYPCRALGYVRKGVRS